MMFMDKWIQLKGRFAFILQSWIWKPTIKWSIEILVNNAYIYSNQNRIESHSHLFIHMFEPMYNAWFRSKLYQYETNTGHCI